MLLWCQGTHYLEVTKVTMAVSSYTSHSIARKLRLMHIMAEHFGHGWTKEHAVTGQNLSSQYEVDSNEAWNRLINARSENMKHDWWQFTRTIPWLTLPSKVEDPFIFRTDQGNGRYEWQINSDGTLWIWILSFHSRMVQLTVSPEINEPHLKIWRNATDRHIDAIVPIMKLLQKELRQFDSWPA